MKREALLATARKHMWAAWQLSSEELASQAAETLIGLGMLVEEGGAQELEKLRTRVEELLAERHSTNEALDDAVQALRATNAASSGKCGRELSTGKPCPDHPRSEAPALTVFRAEHDSIPFGLYTTAEAAREHCEAHERRSWPTGTSFAFDWIEDEEDGVAELVVTAGQNEESTTGYVVTALEVASKYDEGADE